MIICFLSIGLYSKELFFLLPGSIILLYSVILQFKLYVILLEDRLIYQGWFKQTEIFFNDVISFKNSSDLKYPRNKYYGPLTYEICTSNKCILINFLYFNAEFNRELHKILKNKRKYNRNK